MNTDVGLSAGLLWKALEESGALSITDIKAKTKLDQDMVMLALGWLAREDKVTLSRTPKKRIEVALK
jgi:hypothetical protein